MVLAAFVTPPAAVTMAQPVPASPEVPQRPARQDDTITIGWPVRALPFPLNLERRGRPPQSLQELVDRIYRALPEDRLDMFAAYHGSSDFERVRARYDSTVSFFRDLYTIEILYEAGRAWGFDDDHFPLDAARRCVGDDFVDQVAIQIGIRRLSEVGSRGVPAPLRNTAGAYSKANRISRQLFALCDRLHSPRRSRGGDCDCGAVIGIDYPPASAMRGGVTTGLSCDPPGWPVQVTRGPGDRDFVLAASNRTRKFD